MKKLIHIFRAGNHTDMSGKKYNFSESDLQDIAKGYDPEIFDAPAVIGHPKENLPAYGWTKSLVAKGKDLYAELGQVEEQFKDLVTQGRFKKISAAFFAPDHPNSPTPGKFYLQHIGFLGAAAPAVKGLKSVEFSEGPEKIHCFVESIDEMDRNSLADRERALLQRENELWTKGQIRSGHILPREKEFVISFMDNLTDQVYSFAEGSSHVEAPQIDAFQNFIQNRPALVNFSEMTGRNQRQEKEYRFSAPKGYKTNPESLELHNNAMEYAEANKVSYGEAVIAVS